MKFTRDSEDVAALIEAQKTKVVPKIYDAYKLKDGGHSVRNDEETPMYALVMERLRTIPLNEREEIDMSLVDISDIVMTEASADEYCQLRTCSTLDREVAAIAVKLREIGIKWGDIHSGNIGYDAKGKLKALDLGLTKTRLKQRLKILAGLGGKKRPRPDL